MFNFIMDAFNYQDRKVARFDDDDLLLSVDTAYAFDGHHPYETAVEHPDYNSGQWVIVEAYDNKEDAQKGHNKWVEIMTHEPLPKLLEDCQNAIITDYFGKLIYPRERNGEK